MRKRSVSIYAKTKEEYLDSFNRESRRKKISEEEDEYEGLSGLKTEYHQVSTVNSEVELTYHLKLDTKTAEEEEKELNDQLESINNLYKSIKKKEIRFKGKEKTDLSVDDGLSLLCSYFKENIREGSRSNRDPNLVIHQSNKKFPRSMSNNSIADISVKEILDSIVKNNKEEEIEVETTKGMTDVVESRAERIRFRDYKEKNEDGLGYSYLKKDSNKRGSLVSNHSNISNSSWSTQLSNELLAQNLECEEEVLKVMMIGSTHIGKTLLINNFLEMRRNRYEPSSGLEIKKKIVNILNKNVRIEFYDTDANFHLKDTSKIYYKLCDAFFYVVDWSKKESMDYVSQIHDYILNNSSSNSFFLTNLNFSNFKNQKEEKELKQFADRMNFIYIPLEDGSNFQIKNGNILNVFSYVLVKKMKKKNKSKFHKNIADSEEMEKMISAEPSLGFNQSYKLESYNKMNNQISINVKRKFRHSENDLVINV